MPLRTLPALLFVLSLAACAPAGRDASPAPTATNDDASAATGAPMTPTATVAARATTAIHPLHGQWRLVAAHDPHDAALMAFSIQSDASETGETGEFLLFQPFCDLVADAPIVGNTECELIGLGAAFEHVDIGRDRIVLAFQATADGSPHRLELRADGQALAGDYVAEANGIRRPVIARRPPAGAP